MPRRNRRKHKEPEDYYENIKLKRKDKFYRKKRWKKNGRKS